MYASKIIVFLRKGITLGNIHLNFYWHSFIQSANRSCAATWSCHNAVWQGHLQEQVIHIPIKYAWPDNQGTALELPSEIKSHGCIGLITFIHRTLLFTTISFSFYFSSFFPLSNFLLTFIVLFLLLSHSLHLHTRIPPYLSQNLLLCLLISILTLNIPDFMSVFLSLSPGVGSIWRGDIRPEWGPKWDGLFCWAHQEADWLSSFLCSQPAVSTLSQW